MVDNARMRDGAVAALFAFIGLAYLALTIVGTWNNYSSVPFWDMWNGYLEFYAHSSEGWEPWWALHNEHRILLSRAIFWVDLHVFRGSMVLLFTLNVLFSVCIFLCFFATLRRLVPDGQRRITVAAAAGLIAVASFSWIQSDNFTWAFQSQFFLAYLVPLLSFCLLAWSAERDSRPLFVLALLTGMLGAATMANGVLASPVLVVLGLFLRLGWRRIVALLIAAAIELLGYFHDFKLPPDHSTLLGVLHGMPMDLLRYLLMYLGGPWHFVFQGRSLWFPVIGGLLLLTGIVAVGVSMLRARRAAPLQLALLAFLLFFGGTALGTAGGRVAIGVEQAMSSRYLTPQLMAWSALLILLVSQFRSFSKALLVVLALFIPLALLRFQLLTLEHPSKLFDHQVAALAIQMNVRDPDYLGRVYFNDRLVFDMAAEARRDHLSIFDEPPYRAYAQHAGTVMPQPGAACQGYLDDAVPLASDGTAYRITGWLTKADDFATPAFLLVADADGRVIGSALTGIPRPDVAQVIDPKAGQSGFVGYLAGEGRPRGPLTLIGQSPACQVSVELPAAP
ncbi:hypothetical protein [Pseudomonas mangiferae]|uniref:Uncharacterized protein n=1 Tax=Pseudomonas mangiferae TaxID=2593654 RepID=A0A553GZY8_9PSED|nr:hypothetical protein [Pseudomonas mangiferae]TRX75058.1 hypothetical protein FM069_08100 [Pseudomonas mangiferae]